MIRRTLRVTSWLFMAAAIVWLWPAALGGSTRFVVVNGTSMRPTYQPGDLLIARDHSSPAVGDIVLYQVPDGEVGANRLVIHRLVATNQDGTFAMQGDNRAAPDPWIVATDHIVGKPELHIPFAGRVVEALLSWFGLALVAAGLVAWVLWPAAVMPSEAPPPADGATA